MSNKDFFTNKYDQINGFFNDEYDKHIKSRAKLRKQNSLSDIAKFFLDIPNMISAIPSKISAIPGKIKEWWKKAEWAEIAFLLIFILTTIGIVIGMFSFLPVIAVVVLTLTGLGVHLSFGIYNTLKNAVAYVWCLGKDLQATPHENETDNDVSFRRWSATIKLITLIAFTIVGGFFLAPLVPALVTVSLPAVASVIVFTALKIIIPVTLGIVSSQLFGFFADQGLKQRYPLNTDIRPSTQASANSVDSGESSTVNSHIRKNSEIINVRSKSEGGISCATSEQAEAHRGLSIFNQDRRRSESNRIIGDQQADQFDDPQAVTASSP